MDRRSNGETIRRRLRNLGPSLRASRPVPSCATTYSSNLAGSFNRRRLIEMLESVRSTIDRNRVRTLFRDRVDRVRCSCSMTYNRGTQSCIFTLSGLGYWREKGARSAIGESASVALIVAVKLWLCFFCVFSFYGRTIIFV